MNIKFIYAVIILIILVSIQYTLNLILKEIKSMRITIMSRSDDDSIDRR